MGRLDELIRTDLHGRAIAKLAPAYIYLSKEEAKAAVTDALLDDEALPTTAGSVQITAAMPYARNVTIVASAAHTGDVVVHGTNIANNPITEALKLTGSTPVIGSKAFKTVTKIDLPAKTSSETVDVGFGSKLGLPFMFVRKPLLFAYQNSTLETTAPTVAIDDDEVEKNTILLNSALNDAKDVEIFLFL